MESTILAQELVRFSRVSPWLRKEKARSIRLLVLNPSFGGMTSKG